MHALTLPDTLIAAKAAAGPHVPGGAKAGAIWAGLTVLGFSTGTAAAAKGITSGFVQAGKMTKPGALPGEPGKNTGGIFQDDGAHPSWRRSR